MLNPSRESNGFAHIATPVDEATLPSTQISDKPVLKFKREFEGDPVEIRSYCRLRISRRMSPHFRKLLKTYVSFPPRRQRPKRHAPYSVCNSRSLPAKAPTSGTFEAALSLQPAEATPMQFPHGGGLRPLTYFFIKPFNRSPALFFNASSCFF